MSESEAPGEVTKFGFLWGGAVVERAAQFNDSVCIRVHGKSTQKNELSIWVSPTGRSIRVFRGGQELKVTGDG